MASVNMAVIMGNLGQDPELRTTAGGTAVANIRVATNERREDASGDWTDHVEWHSITLFGKTAENVCKYLNKGSGIHVVGRIQTRKWQDKDGKDRYSTEIVANEVQFVGGGKGADDGAGGDGRGSDTRVADEPSRARGISTSKPSGGNLPY